MSLTNTKYSHSAHFVKIIVLQHTSFCVENTNPKFMSIADTMWAEIHKYYEEYDWSKKWAEGLQKILT